jgi:hypothetical protein
VRVSERKQVRWRFPSFEIRRHVPAYRTSKPPPSATSLVTRSVSFSPVFFMLRFFCHTRLTALRSFWGPFPLLPPAVFPQKPAVFTSPYISLRPFHLSHILNIFFLSPPHFPNFVWPLLLLTFLSFPSKVLVFPATYVPINTAPYPSKRTPSSSLLCIFQL